MLEVIKALNSPPFERGLYVKNIYCKLPILFRANLWIDVNKQAKTVSINHPVKGHNPRVVPISEEFLRRLSTLRRKTERVFLTRSMYQNYWHQRRRATRKFANPRLLKINFTTLRHWKGTMEYHQTKDILHVKKILGHKCIQSTMIYINLEAAPFKPVNDEFTVRVANNLEEACELLETGLEYVTDMDGCKIFRKRK